MKFRGKNVTGELLLDYADEYSCLILGLDRPTTNPYIPSPTRCFEQRDIQEPNFPGASNDVLFTELGPPPGTQ